MSQPLFYFDRYLRVLKAEAIYGERWLRLCYENPAGRWLVWLVVCRKFVSAWYGRKMGRKASANLVLPFISRYGINVDDFAKSAFEYKTFNDFFCRALKPGARPVAEGAGVAVFPADGRHLAFPEIDAARGFYVKGAKFTLAELFAEEALPADRRPLANEFSGGAMLISRLCPVDYHRFHFPVDAVPGEPRLCRGSLYSVNPVALRQSIRYLVRNKRFVTVIASAAFGNVAMVEVGATNVGAIRNYFETGRAFRKGDEKGLFAFGGSCVITIFSRGRIVFDADLVERSAECIETYARMGDRMGEAPEAAR